MTLRKALASRALPFVLLFVAAGIVNAVAAALLYGRGLAYALGPTGALIHIPIVLALGLVTVRVLARTKKRSPEELGFVWGPRRAVELGVAALAGGVVVAVTAGALAVTGLVRPSASSAPPSVLALAAGVLAMLANAALQQLSLQGFVLALSKDTRPSAVALAIPALLFAATHMSAHATGVYVANVALFGLFTSLLFFRGATPSFAAPIGFHAAVNFTETFVLGCVPGAGDQRLGILRWPTSERLFSGGALGLDGGLAWTIVLVALIATSLRVRGLRRLAAA